MNTVAVLVEFAELWEKVEGVVLQEGVPDRFIWKWTASGEYTSSSAYQAFFLGSSRLLGASEVWQASAPRR
jgi:hypothetical protein